MPLPDTIRNYLPAYRLLGFALLRASCASAPAVCLTFNNPLLFCAMRHIASRLGLRVEGGFPTLRLVSSTFASLVMEIRRMLANELTPEDLCRQLNMGMSALRNARLREFVRGVIEACGVLRGGALWMQLPCAVAGVLETQLKEDGVAAHREEAPDPTEVRLRIDYDGWILLMALYRPILDRDDLLAEEVLPGSSEYWRYWLLGFTLIRGVAYTHRRSLRYYVSDRATLRRLLSALIACGYRASALTRVEVSSSEAWNWLQRVAASVTSADARELSRLLSDPKALKAFLDGVGDAILASCPQSLRRNRYLLGLIRELIRRHYGEAGSLGALIVSRWGDVP